MIEAPAPVADQIQLFRDRFDRIVQEVSRRIVGQDEVVKLTVTSLLAGGHVLLEGIPGVGKTSLVHTLADVLRLRFARVQFTPDLMPADITGTSIVQEHAHGGTYFEFQPGPVFANIVLADEINRATPRTQSALLEAMQENSVSVGKTTYPLEQPFLVLATQNPIEMEGTYPLPEAQLDRFFFKLRVGYPSEDAIHEILDRTTRVSPEPVAQVMGGAEILEMRQIARAVPIARPVQAFAIRLTLATHPDSPHTTPLIKTVRALRGQPARGAGARAGAKVHALTCGRPLCLGRGCARRGAAGAAASPAAWVRGRGRARGPRRAHRGTPRGVVTEPVVSAVTAGFTVRHAA